MPNLVLHVAWSISEQSSKSKTAHGTLKHPEHTIRDRFETADTSPETTKPLGLIFLPHSLDYLDNLHKCPKSRPSECIAGYGSSHRRARPSVRAICITAFGFDATSEPQSHIEDLQHCEWHCVGQQNAVFPSNIRSSTI